MKMANKSKIKKKSMPKEMLKQNGKMSPRKMIAESMSKKKKKEY